MIGILQKMTVLLTVGYTIDCWLDVGVIGKEMN